jgi:hypothetical protein
MQDIEQAIRERAYHLWAADGCHEGNEEGYWLTAQREILASSLSDVARVATPSKTKKKTKAAPAAKTRRRVAA